MFRIENVQGITKYLLICVLTLSLECQAAINRENDQIIVSTSETIINPDRNPPFTPDISIENQYPILYFGTIVFAAIIIGVACLVTLRSCFCSCRICNAQPQPPPRQTSRTRRLTRPLLVTDPLLYKYSDIPPSYDSVTLPSYGKNTTTVDQKEATGYETPPPSYNCVV